MISHPCQSAQRLGGKISQVEDGDCFDANDAGLGRVWVGPRHFRRGGVKCLFIFTPT